MIVVTKNLEKIFPEKDIPQKRKVATSTFVTVGIASILAFLVVGYSTYIWENKKNRDPQNTLEPTESAEENGLQPDLYLQVSKKP